MNFNPLSTRFTLEAVILVNYPNGRQYRWPSSHLVGEFEYELNGNWVYDVVRFADSDSILYERFQESFASQAKEIDDIITEILGHPRFDHADGRQEMVEAMLWTVSSEITKLCDHLDISKDVFYSAIIDPVGFEVDKVYFDDDLISCCRSFTKGAIALDELNDICSTCPSEVSLGLAMDFNFRIDASDLTEALYADTLCDHLQEEEGYAAQLIKTIVDTLSN